MSWIIFFIGLVSGSAGAWGVFRYGDSLNFVDVANHRSSHLGSVPKGGGIGILFSFLLASVFYDLSMGFWLPVVIISMVSLVGDRYHIPAMLRLFIQIICALIVVANFAQENSVSNYLILFFSIIFIVGTANLYNFMDGINGIAGITSIVAFGSLGFYLYSSGKSSAFTSLCIVFAMSTAGFLPFNLPQAKVFLGDVGSILLGFAFSTIIILNANNFVEFMTMAGFLFIFYFDEMITMSVRIYNGESLIKPHRKHIYQLLANEMKIEHWKISMAYGLVQGMISLVIIIVSKENFYWLLILYLVCMLMLLTVSILIKKRLKPKLF
jgi:Fuc2NAc and GlcNAc transferase